MQLPSLGVIHSLIQHFSDEGVDRSKIDVRGGMFKDLKELHIHEIHQDVHELVLLEELLEWLD